MFINTIVIANAFHGLSQAIGVTMNVLKCYRFGANMSATERVISIAFNGDYLRPLSLYNYTTNSLA